MFFGFPYEAFISSGMFPSTPPHFQVGGNNYFFSSVSFSLGIHKIPKLKVAKVMGEAVKKKKKDNCSFEECQKTKSKW